MCYVVPASHSLLLDLRFPAGHFIQPIQQPTLQSAPHPKLNLVCQPALQPAREKVKVTLKLQREVVVVVEEVVQLLLQQLMHLLSLVIMTQILAIHFLLLLPLSFLQPGQLVCTLRVLTSETQW